MIKELILPINSNVALFEEGKVLIYLKRVRKDFNSIEKLTVVFVEQIRFMPPFLDFAA
jgi:hypothetical protein